MRVRGAVHDGLPLVVDSVQVSTELQRNLHRLEHLRPGPGILPR